MQSGRLIIRLFSDHRPQLHKGRTGVPDWRIRCLQWIIIGTPSLRLLAQHQCGVQEPHLESISQPNQAEMPPSTNLLNLHPD